jgi:hypothetical protein
MPKFKPIPPDIGKYFRIDSSAPSGLRWFDTSHCRNQAVKPEDPAGYWDTSTHVPYYCVIFKRSKYKVHRIIWFLHTREDPKNFTIDHIDRNTKNNSITNLRKVTYKHNADNRGVWGSIEYRGVSSNSSPDEYVANFKNNNATEYLGIYTTPEDAALAWDHRALQSQNSYKILNFPNATDQERLEAVSRRIRRRGTYLKDKKLKGVSFDKERRLFQAYIRVPTGMGKSKMVALGRYPTSYEAAFVRDSEVVRLGLNVALNFPDDMK